MAYRRPGVTVTQEFVGLQPALAAFSLPSCLIGPVYQLVTDDNAGSYSGSAADYDYVSLMAGAQVDTDPLDPTSAFQASQFPVSVRLSNAILTVVSGTGQTPSSTTLFNDTTLSTQFQDVVAGDKLVIASGANAGTYGVRAKISNTQLQLSTPLVDATVTSNPYTVQRAVSSIPLALTTQFTVSGTAVSLLASLTYLTFPILSGTVLLTYRGLRNDQAAAVVQYNDITAVQTVFGVSQITPANPLVYGLQIALQNTVTPVNGLGLDGNFATNEVLSHDNALVVVKTTTMYALCPLSQNPLLAPIYNTFVTAESQPSAGRERVAITNRALVTVLTLQNTETTSTSLSGAQTIVATQTNGAVTSPDLSTLVGTTGQFASVKLGDTVSVTAGTNAITGNYTVVTKTDAQTLVLSGNVATATTTDLAYFIVRQDGISADGLTLYDRNATFLDNGVAPGDFINVSGASNSLAVGRFAIANVLSNHQVQFTASINGITSLVTAVAYDAERNMTKDDQAAFLASYSTSIGSRRVVCTWPDQLSAPVGNTLMTVEGWYGGCSIAALTTGLPTQQGFTNLSLSGFLGLNHSSGYFNDDQLDVIAGGGTMVLAQDAPQQALYVRHQLTSDTSSIKFQEYSVTKNVDYVAKFIRARYRSFIGPYNIIQTTLDDLKTTGKGVVNFLVEARLPRIGGPLRSGSLTSLAPDPDQIDTVKMTFTLDIPIPLNHIDITLLV